MKNYTNKLFILATILAMPLITSCAVASEPEIFKELEFKIGGNGAQCLADGWHETESTHVWSASQNATLNLIPYKKLLTTAPNLDLEITLGSFPGEQDITIRFQNEQVGEVKIKELKSIKLTLPNFQQGKSDPDTTLSFQIPKWNQSPFTLGLDQDQRLLGIIIKSIKLKAMRLDLSISQELQFVSEHGHIQKLTTIPTIGDGDCFNHVAFTKLHDTPTTVVKKANIARADFCDAVQNGEYLEDLRPLVYENFLELLSLDEFDKNVPENIRKMINIKNKYSEMISSMQYFGLATEGLEAPEVKFPAKKIEEAIETADIKKNIERFRKASGQYSYISPRVDINCPANIIATRAKIRMNIFTFLPSTQTLHLYKTVGIEGVRPINLLLDGIHCVRLFDPKCNEEHDDCNQIYNNCIIYNSK